jgi:hypothetical protein
MTAFDESVTVPEFCAFCPKERNDFENKREKEINRKNKRRRRFDRETM